MCHREHNSSGFILNRLWIDKQQKDLSRINLASGLDWLGYNHFQVAIRCYVQMGQWGVSHGTSPFSGVDPAAKSGSFIRISILKKQRVGKVHHTKIKYMCIKRRKCLWIETIIFIPAAITGSTIRSLVMGQQYSSGKSPSCRRNELANVFELTSLSSLTARRILFRWPNGSKILLLCIIRLRN